MVNHINEFDKELFERQAHNLFAHEERPPILVRHKKRGTIYSVSWLVEPMNATNEQDGQEMVLYKNINSGDWYVRHREEFVDGRFEFVERGEE